MNFSKKLNSKVKIFFNRNLVDLRQYKAFTLAEVLIAKRERGKMNLLNLYRTRELKAPSSRFLKQCAFTLAEVLITLGIIGVVAVLTIPALIQAQQESQWAAGILKFNSEIYQAVNLFKQDNGCDGDAYDCILSIPHTYEADSAIITKYMKVNKSTRSSSDISWLADKTLNYYGMDMTLFGCGEVATRNYCDVGYLLDDGTTFTVDEEHRGFDITVDVNGKRPPNRIGKDTFRLRIGGSDFWGANADVCAPKDICYDEAGINGIGENGMGLCSGSIDPIYGGGLHQCDPNNVDPTIKNGAMPTTYVLLNHKVPNFKAISKAHWNDYWRFYP